MCEKVFEKYKCSPGFVPDDLMTQKMSNGAVHNNPGNLMYVPGRFMTQEVCEGVVEMFLIILR